MEAGAHDERPLPSTRWIFALTVAFLYAAAVLRSVLAFDGGQQSLILALLAVWLGLFLAEPLLIRGRPLAFLGYVVVQSAVVAVLLAQSDSSDYFGVLLAPLAMQATALWRPRQVAALVALYAPLTAFCLYDAYPAVQAAAQAAIFTVIATFFAVVAQTAKRADEARARNVALAGDLRDTNRRLAEYSGRAERLAAARERQRLARDLHDSVTQTLFGMTLTAQSCQLLLRQQPRQVNTHLDQLDHLARHALTELRMVSAELADPALTEGGLPAALCRHAEERAARDGLAVTVETDGEGRLSQQEAEALLRIAQEALNNVVKHAGVTEAAVRLRLRRPCRLEIEDRGAGFDPALAKTGSMGLAGMRERAAELGWRLTVASRGGEGTRVVAEEEGEQW